LEPLLLLRVLPLLRLELPLLRLALPLRLELAPDRLAAPLVPPAPRPLELLLRLELRLPED
jgi:hypothetical protein